LNKIKQKQQEEIQDIKAKRDNLSASLSNKSDQVAEMMNEEKTTTAITKRKRKRRRGQKKTAAILDKSKETEQENNTNAKRMKLTEMTKLYEKGDLQLIEESSMSE
jgi:hypothetical protein